MNQDSSSRGFNPTAILVFLVMLGFALRLFQLDKQSLWFDEIITIHLAQMPLIQGLDGLLGQGIQLTPFYHWISKAWLFLGQSDWAVRFPAVLFSLLCIPLSFQLGRIYYGTSTGLFVATIFALNPFQIWYAQEVKVYSALAMSAIGAIYAFGLLLKYGGKRPLLYLAVFNAIGFSAHHFMFLIPTVQFVFIIIHFKHHYNILRGWILATVLPAFILLPWFGFIIARQHIAIGIGWVPAPNIFDPLLTLWNFTLGYQENITLWLAIALGIVIVAFVSGLFFALKIALKEWKTRSELDKSYVASNQLILLWLILPITLVWIFSQGKISFYVDRYFLVITPAVSLLLAIGVTHVSIRWVRYGLGIALILAMLYGTSQIYFNSGAFTKDDWRTMATELNKVNQTGQGLVACADGYTLALNYYGLNDTIPLTEQFSVYPPQYDLNQVLRPYHELWVVAVNPRQPQHHLGYSYPLKVDSSTLSAAKQTSPPQQVNVSGITALKFTFYALPDFNNFLSLICKG